MLFLIKETFEEQIIFMGNIFSIFEITGTSTNTCSGNRATIPLENVVPHKEYFVESYVIEEAVSSAVGHFNDDTITVVHMFGALGMPAG